MEDPKQLNDADLAPPMIVRLSDIVLSRSAGRFTRLCFAGMAKVPTLGANMEFGLRILHPTILTSALMPFVLTACDRLPFMDVSHGAIAACEGKLTDSLISPSSYKRKNANYRTTEFTFDDYYESQGGERCKPFTSSDCNDTEKFFRAMNVKTWLLAKEDIKNAKGVDEVIEAMRRVEDRPFPNVSDKIKWKADYEYIEFNYRRGYGSGKRYNLPSAVVTIDYDAVNSFNAALRSTHLCRFPPTNNDTYSSALIY